MHIKKGDSVIVITGKDKGKSGSVLKALPKKDMVLVEGVNIKKVHQRARGGGAKGQIVEKSFPVHVSNVKKTEAKSASKAGQAAKKKAAKK